MDKFRQIVTHLFTIDFLPWVDEYVVWLRRPLAWLVIATIASLMCGIFVAPQGYVMFAALAILIVLGVFWPWIGMMGVTCTLNFDRRRAREGDVVHVKIAVTNRWPWPLWGLTIERGFFATADGDSTAVSLARINGWAESEFHWEFKPERRGLYPIEAPVLATGFPFGLWSARRPIEVAKELLVWPKTFSLASIPPLSGSERTIASMTSDHVGNEGDVLGTRPYRHGDSLRNVHWAQTARHRRMIVCERQSTARHNVQVEVDTLCDIHDGDGSEGTFEWTLRIAASICQTFHAHNSTVQCRIAGEQIVADPGPNGLHQMLDRFALFDATSEAGASTDVQETRAGQPFVITTDRGVERWATATESPNFVVLETTDDQNDRDLKSTNRWIRIDHAGEIPVQLRRQWEKACHESWCGKQ